MVEMISTLIAHENAYVVDGDVYFRIASFPQYGEIQPHMTRYHSDVRMARSLLEDAGWRLDPNGAEKNGQQFNLTMRDGDRTEQHVNRRPVPVLGGTIERPHGAVLQEQMPVRRSDIDPRPDWR